MRDDGGQASVELLGALPLVAIVALCAGQLLAAGVAREAAGTAAQAGAMAVLQGTDPERAARDAVPGWAHGRVEVRMQGRRVRVRIAPRALVPGAADLLAAAATADAGPTP
jgi:hypothetical protein